MLATAPDIESFIREFEAGSLPKPRWTHHPHLVVGLWYLTHHSAEDALSIVRSRIRAYNEAVGTANTDSGGYHETLTRLFRIRPVNPILPEGEAGDRIGGCD